MNKHEWSDNPDVENNPDSYDCMPNPEMEEALQMEEELYYDRPDVIAGEQFDDRLAMYRNEH